MPFDRKSYVAGYRRGLVKARSELRQAERRIDEELAEIHDEVREARHQVERLRQLDAIEDGDWHDLALH
jgi:hypothetical protein